MDLYRLLFAFLLLLPAAPLIAGDSALDACFECHGTDGMGKSDPMYPVIAGIPAAHIEEAIYAYIDGARQCIREPRMCETVAALTPAEVSAAARYFSGLVRQYNKEDFDQELAARTNGTAAPVMSPRNTKTPHTRSGYHCTGSGPTISATRSTRISKADASRCSTRWRTRSRSWTPKTSTHL